MLTVREDFGLVNTILILSEWIFGFTYCSNIHLGLYLLCDLGLLFFDENVKIPKFELILHHVATLGCIRLDSLVDDTFAFNCFMLTELTTVLLLLSRKMENNTVPKNILKLTWIPLRVILLPIVLFHVKFNVIYNRPIYLHILHLGGVVLHILNLKWTMSHLKLSNVNNYTSLLLLPTLIDPNINYQWYSFSLLLIVSSAIHRTCNLDITAQFDRSCISTLCFISIYPEMHPLLDIMLLIAFNHQSTKYVTYMTRYIYIATLIYHYINLQIDRAIPFYIISGYLMQYGGTTSNIDTMTWHAANGYYLYEVSRFIFK